MKAIATIFMLLGASTGYLFAQGEITFANSSSTLISAGGIPMPTRTSVETTFYFAIFLASPDTVTSPGQYTSFTDPSFQLVGAYNTNSTSTPGRIATRSNLDVGSAGGWSPGSTVDFIVRGWSANAGSTWAEALVSWNGGTPFIPMFIGSSTIGNNVILVAGPQPATTVFGLGPNQVLGFDMVFVPEPTALALAVLGGTTLWANVRQRKRDPM